MAESTSYQTPQNCDQPDESGQEASSISGRAQSQPPPSSLPTSISSEASAVSSRMSESETTASRLARTTSMHLNNTNNVSSSSISEPLPVSSLETVETLRPAPQPLVNDLEDIEVGIARVDLSGATSEEMRNPSQEVRKTASVTSSSGQPHWLGQQVSGQSLFSSPSESAASQTRNQNYRNNESTIEIELSSCEVSPPSKELPKKVERSDGMNDYWANHFQAALASETGADEYSLELEEASEQVQLGLIQRESTTQRSDAVRYESENVSKRTDGPKSDNSNISDKWNSSQRRQAHDDDAKQFEPANSKATNDCSHNVQNGALMMYNWQSTKPTVKERLAFMFNNEILADVHFIVGKESQQQRIPAHRFILSIGSAVFDAMFNSGLANRDDEITLPDVEPASFLGLLKFLYTDEVQIGPETVMTTLYTAKKYAVPALEKHCVDFLKSNLSADNAFMLLTQARLFDESQLAALCLETIDKFTPEALNAEGFIDIDIETLGLVLDRDSLRVKEATLFAAVLRWSEAECMRQGLPVTPDNKRSVLGHVLTKIRFPLMTVEEFAQGPAQSGILTDRECVSLFLHFTVNPKPPVAFLDAPRFPMSGKEQVVQRFCMTESRWGYSGTSDKIRFIVDRRIFVVGFGLYGSIHGPSEYDVSIQLLHTASGRLLGSNETSFRSDGSKSTFRVMFEEPIEILPVTNYTASATLKGNDSHYGTKGLRKVVVKCSSGGRVTFQFTYASGNNNGTSVEDGQIPEIIFYT